MWVIEYGVRECRWKSQPAVVGELCGLVVFVVPKENTLCRGATTTNRRRGAEGLFSSL